MRVHVNGRLVDQAEARVSAFDRGFLFGDGVFESMRAVAGAVFRIERHLERLRRSAALIGLDLPGAGEGLAAAVAELLRANALREARIRITVTRGPGKPGDYLDAPGPPTVVIVTLPFSGIDPAKHSEGVAVCVSARPQMPPDVLDPAVKSISRLSSVLARREARERGAFEAILVDAGGHLTECTVSNLFVVAGGRLLTPAAGACLAGVTREAVLDLARAGGLEAREERLHLSVLSTADELFLTNTSWEVLPAVRVDHRAVGTGRPGPVTRDLLARYRELVSRECGRA